MACIASSLTFDLVAKRITQPPFAYLYARSSVSWLHGCRRTMLWQHNRFATLAVSRSQTRHLSYMRPLSVVNLRRHNLLCHAYCYRQNTMHCYGMFGRLACHGLCFSSVMPCVQVVQQLMQRKGQYANVTYNASNLVNKRRVHASTYTSSTNVSAKPRIVLGIETSCDDTGAALVDENGNILGDAINSQTAIHVEMGGIVPPIARDLHLKHIHNVVNLALQRAAISLQDIDAIATTVRPGLALSLYVGMNYSRQLVKKSGKPFIPIHHMEAHALTARMLHRVEFPFLVLLISGGHCLLAVVRGVDDFIVLGKSLDDAPGDAFDKTARRLKLKCLPQCTGLSGGRAIELLAASGDPKAFPLLSVMSKVTGCDFSFAGIKFWVKHIADVEEKRQDIKASGVLSNVSDLCASFQYTVLHHLAKRLQRALLYCEMKQLLPNPSTLVVSGGVASNMFIRQGLQRMCSQYNCSVVCPPPQLCTDNGIMIAWNGVERLRLGLGIHDNADDVDIQAKCPLGVDVTDEVRQCHIKLSRVKLLD